MVYVIKCMGLEGRTRNEVTTKIGDLLSHFDPEFCGGAGMAGWTDDPEEAILFDSPLAAMELWRTVPKSRPIREDGQPNRPLTAYTVEVLPLDEWLAERR